MESTTDVRSSTTRQSNTTLSSALVVAQALLQLSVAKALEQRRRRTGIDLRRSLLIAGLAGRARDQLQHHISRLQGKRRAAACSANNPEELSDRSVPNSKRLRLQEPKQQQLEQQSSINSDPHLQDNPKVSPSSSMLPSSSPTVIVAAR